MAIKHQLTVPVWLGLSQETRNKLAEIFGIKRTGQRSFQQINGRGEVTSDGHTHHDLSVVTNEAMAAYLGTPVTDEFWATFDKVVEKVEAPDVSCDKCGNHVSFAGLVHFLKDGSKMCGVCFDSFVDDNPPHFTEGQRAEIPKSDDTEKSPCSCGHVITQNLGWHCETHHVSGHGIKFCEQCNPPKFCDSCDGKKAHKVYCKKR